MSAHNAPRYTAEKETSEKAFASKDFPVVALGLPFPRLVVNHIRRLGCQRAFVLVSRSIADKTPSYWQQLKDDLGILLAGERVGVKPHTYWDEVLDIARDA